ncbi:MAG TPA: ROK family protein [Acidimicrobiia bacterium]|nr:ROK family protein [Acidimicrobiia bacterium]
MTDAVGIDVGGSFVKAVRRAGSGAVEARRQQPTPQSIQPLLELVEDMASGLGLGLPVGVGLAALVDHRRRTLVWGPHVPGEQVEIGHRLEQRLGVPVVVDNDANYAALAESRQGAGVGKHSLIMLTLGTGIGMGIVVDGHVLRGRRHAGEVGHITVDPGGDECPCGRRGCWETKVSGRRIAADAVAVLGPGNGAVELVEAARRGDSRAASRLGDAADWLARGVEALVLTLDPELVVVGGAAAAAGDLLLRPVRRRLDQTEGAGHRASTTVVAGILGSDAGAIGAAIAAAEETDR